MRFYFDNLPMFIVITSAFHALADVHKSPMMRQTRRSSAGHVHSRGARPARIPYFGKSARDSKRSPAHLFPDRMDRNGDGGFVLVQLMQHFPESRIGKLAAGLPPAGGTACTRLPLGGFRPLNYGQFPQIAPRQPLSNITKFVNPINKMSDSKLTNSLTQIMIAVFNMEKTHR